MWTVKSQWCLCDLFWHLSLKTPKKNSEALLLCLLILRIKSGQGVVSSAFSSFSELTFRALQSSTNKTQESIHSFLHERQINNHMLMVPFGSFLANWFTWPYLNLKTTSLCAGSSMLVSREHFPKNNKALLRPPRTYWSCFFFFFIVFSSVGDKALLESYFLFAETGRRKRQQGFRG